MKILFDRELIINERPRGSLCSIPWQARKPAVSMIFGPVIAHEQHPASRTAELLGEVAQYESIFLLCYLRGPAGIIVALAEQIG